MTNFDYPEAVNILAGSREVCTETDTCAEYIRPETLGPGESYFLRHGKGAGLVMDPVTFVSYTACPAVIVISNDVGVKKRCLRDDLFALAEPGRSRETALDVQPRPPEPPNDPA